MNFADMLKIPVIKKTSRIDSAGASGQEKSILDGWQKQGWKIQHHPGSVSEAISSAIGVALRGETDMLFCSGADNIKVVRAIDRALELAVPGEFEPVSLMQAMELPTYPKVLWVGFSPLVVYPQVSAAIKSVQRMIRTLDALGEEAARVALLSCVEVISPNVQSTVWEAILAHMSARGQFGKAKVDGPLGLDLAICPDAVVDKGVKTEVDGQADLLIPPDLNSFVTLIDAIHLTGEHTAAGIVIGAPVPIAIPPHRSARHVELSLQVASLLI